MIAQLQSSFSTARLVADPEGRQRELYQVWTSGQLLGYDAQGRLGFSASITASRGQRGPSLGQSRLLGWLQGHPDVICGQRQGTARRCQ